MVNYEALKALHNILVEVIDNYIYTYYKIDHVTKEIAENLIETRLKLFPFPQKGIIDLRNVQWADLAAMRVLSTDDAYKYYTATVVIVNSKVGRLLGNIYYRLIDPPYPTRLFSDIEASLVWLSKITKEPIPKFNLIKHIEEEFTLNQN